MKGNERGSGALVLILIFSVILVILVIGCEWYYSITLRNYIEDELSRAIRISVEKSMLDDYRKDNISRIDLKMARSEFYNYLKEAVGLDSYHSLSIGDETLYKLEFHQFEIKEQPPSFFVSGEIYKEPLFFGVTKEIRIPFSIKVTNNRLEDFSE